MNDNAKPILVIGGGIAGMTAAVEAAEVGHRVVLVEAEPNLGGRVVRSHRYFPKMCPPTCGFEINVRRIRKNPRITVHTLARVTALSGSPGKYEARIRVEPRGVTTDHAIDGSMTEPLTSVRPDSFNLGVGETKALYRPHAMAYPAAYVLDREALSDADAAALTEACPAGSVDLDAKAKEIDVEVGAVVVATGWRPYDAGNLDNLGFGACANVITNVMMERLAAPEGPTGGAIVRPSDGKPAQNVAFVQCAGSRDENHLPYCSAVCCMASLKQTRYLREANPDAKATVFYIDIRTVGRLEKFYFDLLEDEGVSFLKGKVARVTEDAATGNLTLDVEDTVAGEGRHEAFDLVVLATGVVPNGLDIDLPAGVGEDAYGFLAGVGDGGGIYSAGCAAKPCDVARTTKEATAAAMKAIQCLSGGE